MRPFLLPDSEERALKAMETTYTVTDATTWRELDGEIVALDTAASVYFSVGGFGTALWPLLVSGASTQDLVALVTATFDGVPPKQAESDVGNFLASLVELGLIEPTSG